MMPYTNLIPHTVQRYHSQIESTAPKRTMSLPRELKMLFAPKSSKSYDIIPHPGRRQSLKDFLDVCPQHEDIVTYCRELVTAHIYGETKKIKKQKRMASLITSFNNFGGFQQRPLSEVLKETDDFLRTKHYSEVSLTDPSFSDLIDALCIARDPSKGYDQKFAKKFRSDAEVFLKIYQDRGNKQDPNGHSQAMKHEEYWASRQQLLSGKVIADLIAPDYGPLDPVFGILLSPTTGRFGPGDTGRMHYMFHKNDRAQAYHCAAHDAFGYLISVHDIGPGYNYLGVKDPFPTTSPYAGQISGFRFWIKCLKKTSPSDRRKSLM